MTPPLMTNDEPAAEEAHLSPSLQKGGDAFELKMALSADQAAEVETWARRRLQPDMHGDGGVYKTLSVYLDTPAYDVFHRSKGFKRRKYRIRRYDGTDLIHLERKSRKGDRVNKRREVVAFGLTGELGHLQPEPDSPLAWFLRQVRVRALRPSAKVSYVRSAFMGTSPEGTVRLTLDRDIVGEPTDDWRPTAMNGAKALLPGAVMLEMKYHATLPAMFRDLIVGLTPQPGRMSKYRLCVREWGLGDLPPVVNYREPGS